MLRVAPSNRGAISRVQSLTPLLSCDSKQGGHWAQRSSGVGLHRFVTLPRRHFLSVALLLTAAALGDAVVAQAVESTLASPQSASPVLITGEQALDDTVFPGLANRISLDLRAMDLLEVLKFLATKGTFNLVMDPQVTGRVTLTLNDVTVRDAMDIILVSSGLAVERRGTILYVMAGQLYEQLYGHRYGDPRQSVILQLKYANPAQVSALLSSVKSSVGRIIVDEPTATVAMLDTPGVLAQMQALIETVDISTIQREVPTETRVIPLRFAKAEEVKPEVDSVLTPEIGHVRLDKRSNALIVTEISAKLPKVEELIRAFDGRNRQVYIEASILSVTLRDEFDTGIEWTLASESLHFPDLTVTNSLPIASDATSAIKMVVGTLAENDVTATVKALRVFGDTKVLSSPHLSVMTGEDARILVGRREAYVTSVVTQSQATSSTAESIQFVDVGVKLFVTPTVTESEFVTLKIRPKVSSVATTLKTSTGNTIPIVETTEAETKVTVKDNTTILIGGLMKDEVSLSQSKVPLLGDLPLLGVLFKNRSDRIKKTELVILLTPHIMSGEELIAPSSSTARVEWPAARSAR